MARNDDPDSLTICFDFISRLTSGPFFDRKEGLGLFRKEFWFLMKSIFDQFVMDLHFKKDVYVDTN